MYLLHSLAGPLHRRESLSVYIRRLDGVYLLVKGADLSQCLLEAVLLLLLASESRLRSYCPWHGQWPSASHELICMSHTIFVRVHHLPSDPILLLYLALQVLLTLLEHVQLRSKTQDGILGALFPLLRSPAAKPAPNTGGHIGLIAEA